MPHSDARQYTLHAQSTDTFGRVLCSARDHHFIVDGPVQNGCPGEELTPVELFLAGIASCGVELVQVLARQQNAALTYVSADIEGALDRSNPVRPDFTVFNSVRLRFLLRGVTHAEGTTLVEGFTRR